MSAMPRSSVVVRGAGVGAPVSPPRVREQARAARHAGLGVAAAAASAALLSMAFPPADVGALAFVALVPLMLACRARGAAAAAGVGFAFGVAASLAIFHWLWTVPAIGVPQMTVLAAYLALYPAAWCALLPALQRSRVPLAVAAPAAWVALETLRGQAGFLALPWAALAHSQHENLALLQLASVTGEAGVSFVVVAANAAVARFVASRGTRALAVVGASIAAVHALGAAVLASAPREPAITLAAIQPVIPVGVRATAAEREATWQRLEALTLEAARAHPAVIVWPETAVPDPHGSEELAQRLGDLVRRAGVPVVVGASEVEKFATQTADGGVALRTRVAHNAAYLIAADASLSEPYRKRRLVPFAEYLPLEGTFAWPQWLVPGTFARLQPGTAAPRWTLPDGTRIGALICWENLFAALARDAVRDGAQVLVQLTDDGWFGRTAAARQHNLASVLRAVENRVPVVIASNAGPSQVVDAYGRVVRAREAFAPGIVVARVPVSAAARSNGPSVRTSNRAVAPLPSSPVSPPRRTQPDERTS